METSERFGDSGEQILQLRSIIVRAALTHNDGKVNLESMIDIISPDARRKNVAAVVSLLADGLLESTETNPLVLQLTDSGTRFAKGAEAFSKG